MITQLNNDFKVIWKKKQSYLCILIAIIVKYGDC